MQESAALSPREFDAARDYARSLDAHDPLRALREEFHVPLQPNGEPVLYFTGNSLGLQPKRARELVTKELDDWAQLGVEGHFAGSTPWFPYHELLTEPLERLVGAKLCAGEVVAMNSLTVNLHLMMVTFYRPDRWQGLSEPSSGTECRSTMNANRNRILMEWPAFPSDIYAIKSHMRARGVDPEEALIMAKPRSGEETLREDDLAALIDEHGDSLALILMGGVNYYTGQLFDMQRITALGHARGAIVGFDLAHAAGNAPLRLHDWNVDFACWCSYKYLNGGPGGIAGCFVHERHGNNLGLPRFSGWWGNEPATRFRMHLEPEFIPKTGAEGWQISNPPILAMAPLRASLEFFDRAGMDALREKSLRLTGYLRWLLEREGGSETFEIITPRNDAAHGAQLSIFVNDQPRQRFEALQRAGAICDFREPNVIRAAPVPLYNSFEDVWKFAEVLRRM